MGIVEEIGSGVTLLKKGDRVVMPFNVADGRCLNCEEGNTAFCTGVNPGYVSSRQFFSRTTLFDRHGPCHRENILRGHDHYIHTCPRMEILTVNHCLASLVERTGMLLWDLTQVDRSVFAIVLLIN